VRGYRRERTGGWLIAIAPGAFALLIEGLVFIAAKSTGSTAPAWIGIYFWGLAALVSCGRGCFY
jgi:hypothetical protein